MCGDGRTNRTRREAMVRFPHSKERADQGVVGRPAHPADKT